MVKEEETFYMRIGDKVLPPKVIEKMWGKEIPKEALVRILTNNLIIIVACLNDLDARLSKLESKR